MYSQYLSTALLLFVTCQAAIAAEPMSDAPPPPAIIDNPNDTAGENNIPSSVPSVNDETEVTIIKKKETTIEEVRVRGKLRYAKVIPKYGKPYYLYDSNGDGVLDATETDLKKANVNQWILMEW